MGTKHQRFKIDRDFMRALRGTGDYQAYQCDELRGFGVKVTPAGSASYTYRWTKPDGTQGRKTIGYYPAMNPGDARNAAKRESEIIDHKGDTLIQSGTAGFQRRQSRPARVRILDRALVDGGVAGVQARRALHVLYGLAATSRVNRLHAGRGMGMAWHRAVVQAGCTAATWPLHGAM